MVWAGARAGGAAAGRLLASILTLGWEIMRVRLVESYLGGGDPDPLK